MNIEFHYYITYILARKAGFKKNDSYFIAYSSQYVDDNNLHYYVNFKNGDSFMNEVSQTMDITKPSAKRQKIYPLFHFIPGDPDSPSARRKDGKKHVMNTTPNSRNAKFLFNKAIESKNLFRIGVAAHAYADTWAHQNFVGMEHKFNNMPDLIGSVLPNIGHADARHEPDIVDNRWKDRRLVEENEKIENNDRLLDAAEHIFSAFCLYVDSGIEKSGIVKKWNRLKDQLEEAMNESYLLGADDRARKEAYKAVCSDMPSYDKKEWRYEAVEKMQFEMDLFDRYWAKKNFPGSRWHGFQLAVIEHRDLALKKLRPVYKQAGLLA